MPTQCSQDSLDFGTVEGRDVVAAFGAERPQAALGEQKPMPDIGEAITVH